MAVQRFITIPIAQRLAALSRRDPETGCLLFIGCIRKTGYGSIRGENGKMVSAHREAWKVANGPIPKGLNVLHKCDVRNCIEEDHLFLGTHADNVADMVSKNRHRAPQGSRHGRAKLNEDKACAIFLDPRVHQVIAREYDIAETLVQKIKKGLNWKRATASLRQA